MVNRNTVAHLYLLFFTIMKFRPQNAALSATHPLFTLSYTYIIPQGGLTESYLHLSYKQPSPKIFLSFSLSSSSDSPLYMYSFSITDSSLLSSGGFPLFNMTNQQQKKITFFELFFTHKRTALSFPLTTAPPVSQTL